MKNTNSKCDGEDGRPGSSASSRPSPFRIRQATLADLPHILHHRRGMFHDMGYTDTAMLEAMNAASEIYFRAAIPKGAYIGWLATLGDDRVVGGGGVVIAEWPGRPNEHQPRRAWILNIYTEPDQRRKGVARQIMESIVTWCRDNDFNSVFLHASEEGRPLYESMGFKPTNEMGLKLR